MTYREAVERLLALRGGEWAGMRPGLERIEGLLESLGRPERRYAIVQVGGTNGKGSTAVMIAAMLQAAGRRVGLYTSPHLLSFRERIRVNGEAVAEDAVADAVDALGTLIARFGATMFEATTALALDHFARESVEVAVLEVGLGGRLDATTVGTPRVTVLSRIDLDHAEILGPTLADIAREKAAILRGELAVAAAQAPEAAAVVLERARSAEVPLLLEGRDLAVTVESRALEGQRITCAGPGWRLAGLELPLLGTFQPSNALLAVAAARHLGVAEGAVRAGLGGVAWPGRFQVVGRDPTLVLDGAHNAGAARELGASLRQLFPGARITLVLGVSRDKDAGAILGALAPVAERVILTASSNARSAPAEALRAQVPPGPRSVVTTTDAAEALELARRPPRTDVVCVAGSLFLVADVLAVLGGGRDKPCSVEKRAASMGCFL